MKTMHVWTWGLVVAVVPLLLVCDAAAQDTTEPTLPTLSTPSDGATLTAPSVALDWTDSSDVSGILNYDVQVDNDALFGSVDWSGAPVVSDATTAALADGVWNWRVRARDNAGNTSAFTAAGSFTIATRANWAEIAVGLHQEGWVEFRESEARLNAHRRWLGVTRPGFPVANPRYVASGDVDGDGRAELIVGCGRGGDGWFAVYDDLDSGGALLQWVQVGWAEYNEEVGSTRPSAGDVDGDGKDEIVVGLGPYRNRGGGFVVYDDASQGFRELGWRRARWAAYNAANGETRPAVGDTDGDGRAEVVVGLGVYPTSGGWMAVFGDWGTGMVHEAWIHIRWRAYNAANGETYPAVGDADGDGRDEVVVGLGRYPVAGGWMRYLDDGASGYAGRNWFRLPWSVYNNADGAVHPALGNIDGDARDEMVVGLSNGAGGAGWLLVADAPSQTWRTRRWIRVPWAMYNNTQGGTWPAVGDFVSTTPFALGAAAQFAAFGGGSGMTNQGILTVINGDIGTTGVSTTVTGFHDSNADIYTETPLNVGTVNGLIFTPPPSPAGAGVGGTATTFEVATAVARDARIAYNSLSPASLPGGMDPGAGQLGGLTLAPGIYKAAGATFLLTGSDLTLDGQGHANATWVFQTAAGLTIGAPGFPRSIILINGAQAKNVFWYVGSAARIENRCNMVGTIIASSGVTISTAGESSTTTLDGRALGLDASVTMVNTVINVPAQ